MEERALEGLSRLGEAQGIFHPGDTERKKNCHDHPLLPSL